VFAGRPAAASSGHSTAKSSGVSRFLEDVAPTAHDALHGREEAHTALIALDHGVLGLTRWGDILGNAC
jgi:hypothetical protein